MNLKELLTAKSTRLILGGLFAYLGFVIMYHDRVGLNFDAGAYLGGISADIPGGICFVLGIFLAAAGWKAN